MFCEERLKERLNSELFRNVWVHEFYHLKALFTLEQVNTTEWSEKKKESVYGEFPLPGPLPNVIERKM